MNPEDKERSHRRESLSHIYESAIEAERNTGKRESSEERAQRSLLLRLVSIVFGTFITILGVIMLIAPGPGILIMACGLGILAIDVPFARRWLESIKKRLPQDETGRLTKKTIALMIFTALIGITISVVTTWLAFF